MLVNKLALYVTWSRFSIGRGVTGPPSENPNDHDGVQRPQGEGYDFGAFEYLRNKQQIPISQWFDLLAAPAALVLVGARISKANKRQPHD